MQTVRLSNDSGFTPGVADIREQLRKIRDSIEFQAPERARRFLDFIVEETLAGRADYLKAYTIAQEVFGRNASFDAQNDPVVRIEAGRLRRALERYYLVAGQHDAVLITIPKGGYVPSFSYSQPATAVGALSRVPSGEMQPMPAVQPSAPWPRSIALPDTWALTRYLLLVAITAAVTVLLVKGFPQSLPRETTSGDALPVIYVEPFEQVAETAASSDIARGFTDEVIGQLSKLRTIAVVARLPDQSAQDTNGSPEKPRFALQGRLRMEGDRLRLTVRMINFDDDMVVWANSYDRTLRVQSALDMQTDVARSIAAAMAEPSGVIIRQVADISHSIPDDWDSYACVLSYYSYRSEPNPRNHGAVKDCLEKATVRVPTHATIWALLSLTYLDELRYQYKLRLVSTDASLVRARQAADRAVELDPQNVRSLQALMLVTFFGGDPEDALKIGAAAYSLNPNDVEIAGEYGLRLALAGQWDSGCTLLSNVMDRSAGPKGYFEIGLSMCAYMQNDYAKAEAWARRSDLEYNPMHHLVLLATLGVEGKLQEAASEESWIEANAPGLLQNVRHEIDLRVQKDEDKERFFSGLRLAGVAIN